MIPGQVVEFEDLLRPNEAMALLEAARVTAERRLERQTPGEDRGRWWLFPRTNAAK